MKPEVPESEIEIAMRWPEPTSLVFVLDDTLKDVDTFSKLQSVIEDNHGMLYEETKDESTRGLLSVELPPVYRADFARLRDLDSVIAKFKKVERDLTRNLDSSGESAAVVRQMNWHTGSSPCWPGGGSGGGPGARPAPFVQFMKQPPVQDDTVQTLDVADDANIRLVIFDAWNGDDTETQRLVDFATDNTSLLYFLNRYPDDSTFDPRLNNYGASRENDPFPMPDHGLFVAYMAAQTVGWQNVRLHSSVLDRAQDTVQAASKSYDPNQVRDRKGAVTLESVKVLGEYGVGDTYQLIQQLERVAASRQLNERLIINLSLVINTPNPRFAMRRLFDDDSHDAATLHAALHRVIQKLTNQGVLIVAAAGNSSAGEAARQRALYPAAFDEVLGVTAAFADGSKEAYYANRVFSKGVATFGGSVKRDVKSGNIVIDDRYPLDGFFTNSTVPVYGDDPTNDSGGVLWAGTSFATPRIAGLAAQIWANDPSLTQAQVQDKIRDRANKRTLQCGTPFIQM